MNVLNATTPAPAGGGAAPDADRDDSELIRRTIAGDQRAFTELVERHQGSVYGLVARMVREPALAEELTQDVFVKVYRHLDGFRGSAQFSTWLYRIALNTCQDHVASRGMRARRLEIQLESAMVDGHEPAAPTAAPDEELEAHDLGRSVAQSLERLDPIHREAFLLRHQEGLDYAMIAEVLGISVSNAKVRVHRARERMVRELEAAGFAGCEWRRRSGART